MGNVAALPEVGSKGQTAAVIQRVRKLPAANNEILHSAGIAHELLAPAERQFIDGVDHENMIAVEVVWTPRKFLINGEIAIVIVISICVRIGRNELQNVADTLL